MTFRATRGESHTYLQVRSETTKVCLSAAKLHLCAPGSSPHSPSPQSQQCCLEKVSPLCCGFDSKNVQTSHTDSLCIRTGESVGFTHYPTPPVGQWYLYAAQSDEIRRPRKNGLHPDNTGFQHDRASGGVSCSRDRVMQHSTVHFAPKIGSEQKVHF